MNFQLGRYFSISSLVGVVVVIVVLSFFYRYTVVNILIEQETKANTALTKVFANMIWSKYSGFIQKSSTLSKQQLLNRPEIESLGLEIESSGSGSNIADIKIFNATGMTIFSTRREHLGEYATNSAGFQGAMTGETISNLTYNNELHGYSEKTVDRDLLSTYIPLRTSEDNAIHGVFELYTDVTDLVNNVRRTQENIIGGVFITLTLLYLFLQWIVKRADKVIQDHEKARDSSIEQIRYLASHDPMTNLPNKQQFSRTIQAAIDNARQNRQRLALMFIDVDRFKVINDSLGHDAGDELLSIIAKRLQYPVRNGDQLFRWGGDEFTLVLENVSGVSMVENMARRIVDTLAEPIKLRGHEVFVTTSIGIALFSGEVGLTSTRLISNADVAMYQVKRAGRNGYMLYSPPMSDEVIERLSNEASLEQALRNGEFRLYYQPRLSAFSGKVTGVEALLRWEHPQYGLMTPDKFLQQLEDSSLISSVGEWVLKTACRQLAKWQAAGMSAIRVSVNISAMQLSGNIVEQVSRAINEAGINPHYLELEITEGVFVEDKEYMSSLMVALKEIGVTLSIDKFGFEYWPLSYLKKLPVDYIKISHEIITGISHSKKDLITTRAIARIAYNMNIRLVAVGVEKQAHVSLLKKSGCHELQGYKFGEPVLPVKIPAVVAARSAPEARKLALSKQVFTRL
ncbi:putative bifunctional diguanylate cyclase/phosphodiesterase [Kaarinaea lacus]